MPIENNDNLLNTINSHIKLRKLKEVMLLCRTIKLLSISSADKYSKKHLKVREADALKQVGANVREEENKNCSSLYYSDSNSNTATRKIRIKAYSLLDSDDYYLDSSLDINSKDNLEDKEATTAKDLDTFTLRTRQKCEMPKQKIAIDPANSILCDLSDLLVVRFCIFSNSALENIGILTNKEVVEMQTNTATALADKLAAVNKLFALVCGFRKVDRHVFRANNTISVTAQRTITRTVFDEFYNCKLEGIIIAKFY
ncbi:hypothetical protein HBH42_249480 [Parastagonospora nodorum]|nr:hypothetical protein HBH42_249480 [Parastagonospora nodorum]